MEKIFLIGVGPGREALLTLQARRAIDESDIVFAFARHSVLCENAQPLEPLATAHTRILAAAEDGKRVSVLVSGDPCLYSLLGLLQRKLGRENIAVLPGIGAVQSFCARMGVLWQDAKIVSGHGRALSKSALSHEVRTHKNVLLFCDEVRGAAWAAQALLDEDLPHVALCVGERLSYPDEALTSGSPKELAQKTFDPLCLVWFDNPAPEKGAAAHRRGR
jgi:precorrin-6y C5,15-methyltransferase (decarboxylating), CbiE subunit